MTAPDAGPAAWPSAVIRGLDVVIATVVLLVSVPLLLLIAVAIRIDSGGPVLFRQRRVGRDLVPFTVNKFRTMAAGADPARHRAYVHDLIANGRDSARHGRDALFKLAGDRSITPVGRLLRRTSLDELPQLWNVIRGEMSLVGPRPVIAYELESYPGWYYDRFRVKPGLTGLWQVSGRNQRTYEEMVELDIQFVRRRSVLLYLGILVRTAWVIAAGRGAA